MAIRLVVHGPSTALSSPARAFVFDQPRITLGRAASSDVLLPHASVSVTHATIKIEGTGYFLTDEGSTNGTRVDSVKIPPMRPKRLESGNLLQLGAFAVKVELLATTTELTDAKAAARAARALLLDALAADGRSPGAPHLAVGDPPRELSLEGLSSPITLGRDPSARVQLDDPSVSRIHAQLVRDADTFVLEDAGGQGVLVDGKPVSRKRLRSGDVFTLGAVSLRFVDPVEEELEALRTCADHPGEPPLPSTDGASPAEPTPEPGPGLEPPRERAEPPPAATETPLEAPPKWQPRRAPRREDSEGPGTSDAVVFMLAGAMIALSLVGLYLLFGDF
jgi:pSer/pThr/pTyr-binding forkhead associated (FHA) protein